MKTTRKILALVLAVVMTLALAVPAFADPTPTNPGSITINDSVNGKNYDLCKIFDLTGSDTSSPADGEYDNVAYTIASKWAGFFATGAAGAGYIVDEQPTGTTLSPISINGATKYINITDSNVAAFAQAALAYAAANNIAFDATKEGDGNDLVVDDLPLGYYMVYPRGAGDIIDGNASICSLTSTIPTAEVNIKAEYPTIDKVIDDGTTDGTKVNEAGIGDIVPFVLTSKIPDMTGYEKYFFVAHDTLSDGLTLVNEVVSGKNTGFVVTIGSDTLVEGTEYDVAIDSTGKIIRIIFKDMVGSHMDDIGKTVTIKYSAKLNDTALVNQANKNTATIEYSNDPYVDPTYTTPPTNPDDPEDSNYTFKKGSTIVDPTEESEKSETETYTTSLTILKVDDKGEILSGAEFTLTGNTNRVRVTTDVSFTEATDGTYYMLKDGKYTQDAPVAEDAQEATDGEYVVKEDGYELREGQDSFTVGGVTYRALETSEDTTGKTLYKHILSNEDKYDATNISKKFKKSTTTTVLTDDATTDIKGTVDETTGLLIFEGLGAGDYTLTESVTPEGYNTIAPVEFTISFNSTNKTFNSSNVTLELTEIVNKSGSELPSTGGVGTTLFITFGAIAMVAAGIFLVTNKRISKEEI